MYNIVVHGFKIKAYIMLLFGIQIMSIYFKCYINTFFFKNIYIVEIGAVWKCLFIKRYGGKLSVYDFYYS